MKLVELFESDSESMYEPTEDQRGYELSDRRKPTLTLKDLNKLRKYRDFKKAQDAERDTVVSVVYATPAEPPQTGGF